MHPEEQSRTIDMSWTVRPGGGQLKLAEPRLHWTKLHVIFVTTSMFKRGYDGEP
jgi:hypothetical protein